jgi:putative hemolysin
MVFYQEVKLQAVEKCLLPEGQKVENRSLFNAKENK